MAFAKKRMDLDFIKEIFFPVISLLLVLTIVWVSSENLSKNTDIQLLDIVKQSVVRSAVQCYALEGIYPQSLSYLEENYGLYIDYSKYVVHYQSIGSNLMPQVSVFLLQENNLKEMG